MAAAGYGRTRARDVDRTAVCAELDTAYADGQLDGEAYRARTASAMAATTLAELRALVEDLQVASQPVPEPLGQAGAGISTRKLWIAVAVAAVVIAAGTIGVSKLVSGSDQAGSSAGAPLAGGVAPVVVAPQQLHTPAGLAALIQAVRTELKSTQVARAVIYPEYAIITTAVPEAPQRAVNRTYRGGFDAPTPAGTRNPAEPLVDLAGLDVTAILGLLAGAPQSLNVANPTSRYLIVDATGGQPRVAIYASNEFQESGYLTARPNGQVVAVYPFNPQR